MSQTQGGRARARDLGIKIGRLAPGQWNAITDVPGVKVGHTTLIEGEGPLVVGQGPVRTGVTVILPHEGNIGTDPVFAGYHVLNGNGEMTGLVWLEESGTLSSPVAITNTHSVGVVHDALIAYTVQHGDGSFENTWSLPVVAETYDGFLNDINGFHVRPEHVFAALDSAASGPVAEGNVGGGTGMMAHGFKGGIGTASRRVPYTWPPRPSQTLTPQPPLPLRERGSQPAVTPLPLPLGEGRGEGLDGWTVGVLVQANYGQRALLRIDGVPVGEAIPPSAVPTPIMSAPPPGTGSIIVIVATDAPLLPGQCRKLAQRAALGIGRMGGLGENSSGDILLAFATGNRDLGERLPAGQGLSVRMLPDTALNGLFEAVVEATEEAIVNALCMAETMVGRDGHTAYALPLDRLQEVMRQYGRLV
ncbi:MAG: P1 family peptidase [Anaerolineae bacterium]|nr:P1 family peptidase [Anaerolineae bacterium]